MRCARWLWRTPDSGKTDSGRFAGATALADADKVVFGRPTMTNGPDTRRAILVIDADSESHALMSELLAGHALTFSSSAYEAIRALNARAFHAYILDYWLPDWSGVLLCKSIRDMDPNVPILFCSRSARDEDRKRGLRAGANAYLSKPIDAEHLRRELRVHLEVSELASLRAKIEEENAVQHELERRLERARSSTKRAEALAAASVERTARTKAYKAFIDARGSRAYFESWWPNVFGSVRASNDASPSDDRGPL